MKVTIDTDNNRVIVVDDEGARELSLTSAEAFGVVSDAWLRVGWDVKYVYSFTWLGRPIIQLPEDMFRLQEIIWSYKPDIIIETGVAHGGSLVFYASLCRALGKGRVIGIDVEIRPHNRIAIEHHCLSDLITLIEGDSTAPEIVSRVDAELQPDDRVIVLLDSNHSKRHVLAELDAYASLVSPPAYIVVMDGIMERLVGAPRSKSDWATNNPRQAVLEWVASHPEFILEEPPFAFNEGLVRDRVTYWPDAFIRRVT